MLSQREAREILWRCNAMGDYHVLSSYVVDCLCAEAKARRYRKSKNAPGSTARMFHAYLMRRAADRPFSGFVRR